MKLCDGNTDTNLIQRDATLERLAGEIAKRRAVGARQDPTTAPEDLRNLLRPYDESLMEAYAGSCLVNSVKNDTEECIEPIEDIQ